MPTSLKNHGGDRLSFMLPLSSLRVLVNCSSKSQPMWECQRPSRGECRSAGPSDCSSSRGG